MIAFFAAVVACFVLLVLGSVKSTAPYKLALAKAQNDARVQQRLGTPIEAGMFPSDTINVSAGSGMGKADLSIPISGPKGKATIYVDATKSAGEWRFNRLEVSFEGDSQRVDLLAPPPAPPPDH